MDHGQQLGQRRPSEDDSDAFSGRFYHSSQISDTQKHQFQFQRLNSNAWHGSNDQKSSSGSDKNLQLAPASPEGSIGRFFKDFLSKPRLAPILDFDSPHAGTPLKGSKST